MYQTQLSSPLGLLTIHSNGESITTIEFASASFTTQLSNQPSCAVLDAAKAQLSEYFSGVRQQFDLPLAPLGSPFQQRVWQALKQVHFGQTASYAAIAKVIDNPKGVRAVGMANSKNPLPIVVPCHRIIGANGRLTGYAGGLSKKAWLLQHEGCHYSK